MKLYLYFSLLLGIVLGVNNSTTAQTIVGPTDVSLNGTYTYSFTSGHILFSHSWAIVRGTKISETQNGLTYSVSIKWTSTGAGSVKISDNDPNFGKITLSTLNVTISLPLPPVPNTSFTITQNCNQTIVQRSSNPPAGVKWYWQTSATGASLTDSAASITRTTSGDLFLRARFIASPNDWSTTSQSVGTISIIATPPTVPATSTNGDIISDTGGPVSLSVSTVSGATSYRWYTVASSGTPIAGANTISYSPTVSGTTLYYVEAVNGNCPSTSRKAVTAFVHPRPVIQSTNQGTISLARPVTLSVSYGYQSYQWKRNGSNIPGETAATHNAKQPGEYTVLVSKGTATATSLVSTIISGLSGQNMNYIVSNAILKPGVSETDIDTLSVKSLSQNVQYFDGLGRLVQTITTQGSRAKKDIIQPVLYDVFGRELIKYLPYVSAEDNGWYKANMVGKEQAGYTSSPQYQFYNNGSSTIAQDTKPYSESILEASPIARVIKQGSPGNAWQPDNMNTYSSTDHTVKFDYTFNTSNEVLLWTYGYPDATNLFGTITSGTGGNYYPADQLYKNKTKDEHGNEVIEFKDKKGKVILKKVQVNGSGTYAQTYYIYDDFGQLVCVIQPEGVKLITKSPSDFFGKTDAQKNTFLGTWAFRYNYDGRKRMTMKQVPGAAAVYMVYDKLDRLVMTQDGNQRVANNWLYTKYDVLNRPIMTGIYVHGSSVTQAQMSALISTTNFYETYNGNSSTHGYTSTTGYFPNTGLQLLTATYYDDYRFKSMTTGLDSVTNDLTGQATMFRKVLGKPTGTKVNILGSSNYLYSVTYYDDRSRVIQTISQNHKSGSDRATNKYDFVGKVLETKRTYLVSGVTKTVKEIFTYDHAGRLLTVKHSTNGASDVMIVKNDYNELGQLVDKQLHSRDNGSNFKQSVDYRYNIRGWLTKINESDIDSLASGETLGDYFGMELGYNNAITDITATSAFNGNISAIKWSTGVVGASNLQGNAYEYDSLNRLKNSSHYKDALIGWTNDNSNLETGFNYDLNGNIKRLTRKGDAAATIDNLSYYYTGNQLNYVNDSGDATKGFINGNTGTDDYAYDVNGNMIKDKNKGINNNNDIKYNHLNLPVEVVKGPDKIKYYYDATGRKLYQELYTGASVTKTTDYVGELVFENNALQFMNHSEGRVLPDGANWEYQYHLKDHLGNVRLTFTTKTPTAVEHTATFEDGTQTTEQTTFNNYSSIGYDLVDHTDAGTTYQKVQILNGGVSGRVGLAKSYSVMPGDKIKAEVYAKYRNLTGSANSTAFISALASAFGTSSAATGELGKLYTGLNNYASLVSGGDHYEDDDAAPKAFVTIILFDKNYNLVDAAWDQISNTAEQVSGSVKSPPIHDYMTKEITVSEAGYAYVFLSNEHPTDVDIYYDDVKFTHTPSPVIGVNDYYPFGLTFNSYIRENSLTNRYLYNGKEKQDELDLGWMDYGARMYIPEIGRWGVIDPLSEKMRRWSPYN